MKLQDLHVFMTVVQAGSMGKAAQRLNTVQPAVSRSIAELEQALGVRLLERHRQGIEPNEYGRALLDCGLAAFDDLRQGVKNIEFLADPTSGEVRIGCNVFLATSFVSAVVDRISRRYPRIVFDVVATPVERLHDELRERNVDLLIARRLGPIADEQLDFELLFNDKNVVVAGANNPWVRRRRVALADLVNEPWALQPADSVMGSIMREAFRASGLEDPRATVLTFSPHVRLGMLATGRFLTIHLASLLRFPVKRPEFKILPIKLPIAEESIGIVTLRNRQLSPVARLFIEHAREIAKPLKKTKS